MTITFHKVVLYLNETVIHKHGVFLRAHVDVLDHAVVCRMLPECDKEATPEIGSLETQHSNPHTIQ